MKSKYPVGTKVRLNKEGFETVKGLQNEAEVLAQIEGFYIVEVDEESGDDFAMVMVDGPFEELLLTDYDLEPVE